MIFTALSYLLIVALAIAALGTLLLPVYVWVLARDKAQAADLANARQVGQLCAHIDDRQGGEGVAQRPPVGHLMGHHGHRRGCFDALHGDGFCNAFFVHGQSHS